MALLDNDGSFVVGIIIGVALGACAIFVIGGMLVFFIRRNTIKKLKAKANCSIEYAESSCTSRSLTYIYVHNYLHSYVYMYVCMYVFHVIGVSLSKPHTSDSFVGVSLSEPHTSDSFVGSSFYEFKR